MKILINCINLLTGKQGAGGAGQYVYHLIKELAQLQEVTVLVNIRNYASFTATKNLKVIPLASSEVDSIHNHFSWCDIYLCPLNELVPEFVSTSKPVVATILDVQHEVLPHFFKDGVYEQRNIHYSYAINRADAVITISQAEQKLIQSLYSKQAVYVTYLAGYLSRSFSGTVGNLPEDLKNCEYLLYPAIPWRHKNHYRLIEAFWLLKSQEKFSHLKLVLTGATHELASGAVSSLIKELHLSNDIVITGHVSNDELVALLQNTSAMVFPSLYEGFGIPVVDAMEFSIPVIASPIPAISEVCDSNISYFRNPYDSVSMAEDISKFLDCRDSESTQSRIRQAADFAQNYSPKKTALKTLEVLEKTIATHQSIFHFQQEATTYNDASEYLSNKATELTVILDFKLLAENRDNQNLESIRTQLKSLATLISNYNFDCKFLILLPRSLALEPLDISLEFSDFSDQRYKRVFYEDTSEASYTRAYAYMFDSIVDTKCFLIASEIENLGDLVISAKCAINTLDFRQDFSAVKILRDNQAPKIQAPLTDTELITAYEVNKCRRLSFFTDMVLRTSGQNKDSHVGTYRFLNEFLTRDFYIKTCLGM